MSSAVSSSSHTFTGQAESSKRLTSKVLQNLNEINTSLQTLLNGNEKRDDTDDDADAADGQHSPYVYVMLRRRRNKSDQNIDVMNKRVTDEHGDGLIDAWMAHGTTDEDRLYSHFPPTSGDN